MPKITLYQPPGRPWGSPNLSPFCIKLECYLRMAKLPYDVAAADPRRAPKGKIPYVRMDGEVMGDSQLIIERLESHAANKLDANLTREQRAIGHAVQRMLDEAYYFVGLHGRWATDDGFDTLKPEFHKILPGPLRLALPLIRLSQTRKLKSQGTGRHSPPEIAAFGKADWDAVSTLLGESTFLFGSDPSTYDASVFGFLEATLGFPNDGEVRRHASGLANLVRYREHMKKTYFAEL
jgi:glutathione S-transferase